jgi:hypothetical protein
MGGEAKRTFIAVEPKTEAHSARSIGEVRPDGYKIGVFGTRRVNCILLGAQKPAHRGPGIAKSPEPTNLCLGKTVIRRMQAGIARNQRPPVRPTRSTMVGYAVMIGYAVVGPRRPNDCIGQSLRDAASKV